MFGNTKCVSYINVGKASVSVANFESISVNPFRCWCENDGNERDRCRCENAKFTLAARLCYFLHLAPRAGRFLVLLLVDESKAAVAVKAPILNYTILQIPRCDSLLLQDFN